MTLPANWRKIVFWLVAAFLAVNLLIFLFLQVAVSHGSGGLGAP
jgi:hypothetical protein